MARTAEEAFKHTVEVAKAAGLTLLTTAWTGAQANYLFRCSNGHEFERLATSILYKNATACPECKREALRDRWMGIVRERGGELVGDEFTTVARRYRLRCAQGHEWEALGQHIVAGHWCRRCVAEGNSARLLDQEGLARLQAAARSKGGRCLATEYVGRAARYELECSYGHRWQTKGGFILDGHWCPHCARKQSAEQQRRSDGLQRLQAAAASRSGACLSESYTGLMARYRFRCAAGHEWQSFAGSILGGTWCTACRFDEVGAVAFERLHAAVTALGWRCLSGTWAGYNERYEFECGKGHRFTRNAMALLYRGEQARCEACEADEIEERWLTNIADRRGVLLNGPFGGLLKRYRLRCAEGHEWETTGELIRRGKWCPECGRVKSAQCNTLADGLERLQAIARQHGGQCLAAKYTRSCDHYPFECSKGHRWKASGQMVVHGHWCPQCAGLARRLTLESMQAIARERGGLCLSPEYHGAHVKLTWQCHQGHVWQSSPANVKNKGRWCPNCAFLEMTKDPKKRLKWDFEGKG
ncbi:hypothetical protein [Burkholderia sp. LMG 32019]|uniref:hypothetical protein n=1 Tax=Burkholderia sp. LMG 32019 TaxID=3158173 RepID=UPI003C308559